MKGGRNSLIFNGGQMPARENDGGRRLAERREGQKNMTCDEKIKKRGVRSEDVNMGERVTCS